MLSLEAGYVKEKVLFDGNSWYHANSISEHHNNDNEDNYKIIVRDCQYSGW